MVDHKIMCSHEHEHGENCACNHEHEHNFGIGYYLSPIGFIKIITDFDFVSSITFVSSEEEKAVETLAVLDVMKQLDEYFKGERKTFNLKLVLSGTPFQKEVYKNLLRIPYGTTVSYNDIAVMVGRGRASRAVGSANNKNHLLFIIPCHRVTRKNGKLSGTKDWVIKQAWLIEKEKSIKEVK